MVQLTASQLAQVRKRYPGKKILSVTPHTIPGYRVVTVEGPHIGTTRVIEVSPRRIERQIGGDIERGGELEARQEVGQFYRERDVATGVVTPELEEGGEGRRVRYTGARREEPEVETVTTVKKPAEVAGPPTELAAYKRPVEAFRRRARARVWEGIKTLRPPFISYETIQRGEEKILGWVSSQFTPQEIRGPEAELAGKVSVLDQATKRQLAKESQTRRAREVKAEQKVLQDYEKQVTEMQVIVQPYVKTGEEVTQLPEAEYKQYQREQAELKAMEQRMGRQGYRFARTEEGVEITTPTMQERVYKPTALERAMGAVVEVPLTIGVKTAALGPKLIAEPYKTSKEVGQEMIGFGMDIAAYGTSLVKRGPIKTVMQDPEKTIGTTVGVGLIAAGFPRGSKARGKAARARSRKALRREPLKAPMKQRLFVPEKGRITGSVVAKGEVPVPGVKKPVKIDVATLGSMERGGRKVSRPTRAGTQPTPEPPIIDVLVPKGKVKYPDQPAQTVKAIGRGYVEPTPTGARVVSRVRGSIGQPTSFFKRMGEPFVTYIGGTVERVSPTKAIGYFTTRAARAPSMIRDWGRGLMQRVRPQQPNALKAMQREMAKGRPLGRMEIVSEEVARQVAREGVRVEFTARGAKSRPLYGQEIIVQPGKQVTEVFGKGRATTLTDTKPGWFAPERVALFKGAQRFFTRKWFPREAKPPTRRGVPRISATEAQDFLTKMQRAGRQFDLTKGLDPGALRYLKPEEMALQRGMSPRQALRASIELRQTPGQRAAERARSKAAMRGATAKDFGFGDQRQMPAPEGKGPLQQSLEQGMKEPPSDVNIFLSAQRGITEALTTEAVVRATPIPPPTGVLVPPLMGAQQQVPTGVGDIDRLVGTPQDVGLRQQPSVQESLDVVAGTMLRTSQRRGFGQQRQTTQPFTDVLPREGLRTILAVTELLGQREEVIPRRVTKPVTETAVRPTPISPAPPTAPAPPSPPRRFVWGFIPPIWGKVPSRAPKQPKGKRQFLYKPSLAALMFDIRGKMPRKLSGASIRPITEKFEQQRAKVYSPQLPPRAGRALVTRKRGPARPLAQRTKRKRLRRPRPLFSTTSLFLNRRRKK